MIRISWRSEIVSGLYNLGSHFPANDIDNLKISSDCSYIIIGISLTLSVYTMSEGITLKNNCHIQINCHWLNTELYFLHYFLLSPLLFTFTVTFTVTFTFSYLSVSCNQACMYKGFQRLFLNSYIFFFQGIRQQVHIFPVPLMKYVPREISPDKIRQIL